jgi:sulfide dehydrogenase [flavocytochrome c] flavoprotein subunit
MTHSVSRRTFLAGAAAAGVFAPALVQAQAQARLLVVGGGFGGASAANYARRAFPWLQVTLVEPQTSFVTCPYRNLVLAGQKSVGEITHSYDGLRARGVRVVHDYVTGIDATARTVRLRGGETIAYDKMILSPGIAIRWGALEGYDEAAAQIMPHAWTPGDASQTQLLRRQLEAMPDGGVVGFAIPGNPFRCPPGPYERISMVASYLKRHKPRSKIIALDAKEAFSKQGLFQDAWNELYPGMIEWVPGNKDGRIVRVDAKETVLESEFGQRHKFAVANVIPPQAAAAIVRDSGFADQSGWAPINPLTFESRSAQHIHIIGDSNIPGPMPKSGYIANSTAKQAVASAAAALRGETPPNPVYYNTCYSHVGDAYGISVVGVYRPNAEGTAIVEMPNSGGVSPRGALPEQRRLEALYADAWYQSITRDMFA